MSIKRISRRRVAAPFTEHVEKEDSKINASVDVRADGPNDVRIGGNVETKAVPAVESKVGGDTQFRVETRVETKYGTELRDTRGRRRR
ncbi:MAG TPA: hypothetical protein VF297_10730 [Pyrinomonadaceae bacterium]